MIGQVLFGALVGFVLLSPAAAQLVIEGETVASAQTLQAAKVEGRLLAYGVYPPDAMNQILAAFQTDTGIKTEFVRLASPALFQRVTAEQAAGKLEADYIDISDLTLAQQLIELGIMNVPHRAPAFEQIPADIKDASGRWYAVIRPISIIAANLSRTKEESLPTSWKDILDPKWRGQIGLPNIDTGGGAALTLYFFLRDRMGAGFWSQLAAQQPKIYPTVSPLASDIARGEIALGIGAIAEPIAAQIKSGAPLRGIFPQEGIAAFGALGGISSSAKNPNVAALFVNWLVSKRGGNAIARVGAYPANPAAGRPELAGLSYPPSDKVWNLKLDDLLSKRDVWMQEWRNTFRVN